MLKLNGWNRLGVIISLIWLLVVTFILIAQLNHGPGQSVSLVEDIQNREAIANSFKKLIPQKDRKPVTDPVLLQELNALLDAPAPAQIAPAAPTPRMDVDAFLDSSMPVAKKIVDPFDTASAIADTQKTIDNPYTGLFDDLIPQAKPNYQIKVKNTFMLALLPIFIFWISAYLTIWSIRWVVDGFKGNGR
jgi:hypothetical protein